MKNIFFIAIVLITSSVKGQFYVDTSVDPNKIFNVIDNARTDVDHQGLDWDLEVGLAPEGNYGIYIFYGRFEDMKWQNYGLGLDYYILRSNYFDFTAGGQINSILRLYDKNDGKIIYDGEGEWGQSFGLGARITGTYWLLENFGASGRFQYITRPDLGDTSGDVEGSIGLRYKF